MAHSTVRFAAGAGIVAASLLIVGPNPAQAVADKHGSGPHSDLYGKNGHPSSRPSNWVKGVLGTGNTVGADEGPLPDLDPSVMDLGPTGSDISDLAVANSVAPQGQIALRSAAVPEPPAGDNVSVAAPRGGSGYSGQPVTPLRSPRVVVGNGRTPGAHVSRAGGSREAVLAYEHLTAPEAVPAAPAVPSAIEIDIPPLPPPLPPIERIRPAVPVVSEFGTGTTDTLTDPLAGVAGLILIPAVGAVLGFRQARAAQSLRDSLRT